MARTKDFDENEVLTRAMHIFWTNGYNTTSMEDLVSGLGISRSSLYATYTDKHTLFMKVLEKYQEMGDSRIQGIITNGQLSAKETVQQLMELATDRVSYGNKSECCFMTKAGVEVAPHDKEVNKLVCKNDRQMEETLYQVIQKGQQNGEIKNSQEARSQARLLFTTLKGLQVTPNSGTDRSVSREIIALAVATLDQKG